jgi:DNA repair protein RadC
VRGALAACGGLAILDCSARREPAGAGNPAQKQSRIAVMSETNSSTAETPTRTRRSPRRAAAIAKETGTDLLQQTDRLSAEEARVLAEARAILLRLAKTPGRPLVSPSATRRYLTTLLALEERELFLMLALDSRHRIVASEILFAGTVDGASVHPREVVKCALRHNATAVIFSHNHPSGVAEPSQADEIITTRLRDALALVDIRVLDHLIIGAGSSCSLAERGLL